MKTHKWYTRNDLVHNIRNLNCNEIIAQRLADWFRLHLNHAFDKGYSVCEQREAQQPLFSTSKLMEDNHYLKKELTRVKNELELARRKLDALKRVMDT